MSELGLGAKDPNTGEEKALKIAVERTGVASKDLSSISLEKVGNVLKLGLKLAPCLPEISNGKIKDA